MWKSLESAGVTLISNEESTDSNTTVEEAKQSAIILDDVLRISVLRFLASSELPSNSPQVQTTVQVQVILEFVIRQFQFSVVCRTMKNFSIYLNNLKQYSRNVIV